MPLVYGELRQLAQRRMLLENPGASLQPTALVNELYLRLAGAHGLDFHNRSQFFALAAQMMRRILVDAARTRGALKRSGIAVGGVTADRGSLAWSPDGEWISYGRMHEGHWKLAKIRDLPGATPAILADAEGVNGTA